MEVEGRAARAALPLPAPRGRRAAEVCATIIIFIFCQSGSRLPELPELLWIETTWLAGGRETWVGRGRGRETATDPLEHSLRQQSSAGCHNALGLSWEWVEPNLRMRAAMAVAKMVEKGRVVGLGASQGVL